MSKTTSCKSIVAKRFGEERRGEAASEADRAKLTRCSVIKGCRVRDVSNMEALRAIVVY